MAKNVTVKASTAVANLTCYGFHVWAEDFLIAADRYTPVARQGSFVPHFLCCQSIELSLKAFLSLRGLDRHHLKNIGHNLDVLLQRAINHGIIAVAAVNTKDQRTLQPANKWYDSAGGKRFQYFAVIDAVTGFKNAPKLAPLRDIADRLQSKALRQAVLEG